MQPQKKSDRVLKTPPQSKTLENKEGEGLKTENKDMSQDIDMAC